jgi:hypothetical protein
VYSCATNPVTGKKNFNMFLIQLYPTPFNNMVLFKGEKLLQEPLMPEK